MVIAIKDLDKFPMNYDNLVRQSGIGIRKRSGEHVYCGPDSKDRIVSTVEAKHLRKGKLGYDSIMLENVFKEPVEVKNISFIESLHNPCVIYTEFSLNTLKWYNLEENICT